MNIRPTDLAEFEKPPLVEVSMGVQFGVPKSFSPLIVSDIVKLYKDSYPDISYRQAYPPAFETFGMPPSLNPSPEINFAVTEMPAPVNYWMNSNSGADLLQIQNDRFMHNWRKTDVGPDDYPRFERIIDEFSKEVEKLEDFYKSLGEPGLQFNQVEIAYHNTIYLDEFSGNDSSIFLSTLSLSEFEGSDFTLNWRKTIYNDSNEPIGRLHATAQSGLINDKCSAVMYSLVTRGKPNQENLASCLNFLKLGRRIIVKTFESTTTPEAHKVWRKS